MLASVKNSRLHCDPHYFVVQTSSTSLFICLALSNTNFPIESNKVRRLKIIKVFCAHVMKFVAKTALAQKQTKERKLNKKKFQSKLVHCVKIITGNVNSA